MLAFLIAFFNQMSGINAILYFAPRIFEMSGLGAKAALLQTVGIGVTNLIFTFVGLWLIDRLGTIGNISGVSVNVTPILRPSLDRGPRYHARRNEPWGRADHQHHEI